jgi:hypothetical protein
MDKELSDPYHLERFVASSRNISKAQPSKELMTLLKGMLCKDN